VSQRYSICRAIVHSRKAGIACLLLLGIMLTQAVAPAILAAQPARPSSPTAQNPPVQKLEAHSRVESILRGGESHTYEISLDANQYLRVGLEQRSSNLALTLLAPDGSKVAETDTPHQTYGVETILFIANAPGIYRLTARSTRQSSPARSYEIRVQELRPATPEDADRTSAFRQVCEAERLFKTGDVDAQDKAIEHYKSAASLYQKTGEPLLQAIALKGAAFTHEILHEAQIAYDIYLQALPLLQNSEYRQEPALTLGDMGRTRRRVHKYRSALDHFQQALELFRANGNHKKEADVLLDIAVIYHGLGEAQKAINTSQQSAILAESEGDSERQAQALNNLGRVYASLADPALALHYYLQAIPLVENRAVYESSSMLAHAGRAYTELGEHEKALGYFTRASAIMERYDDIDGRAIVQGYMAETQLLRGEAGKALANASEALVAFRRADFPLGAASALNQIGKCHEALGDLEKALDFFRQALQVQQTIEDKVREAVTRYNIARVERRKGNLNEAIAQVEAAIEVTESRRVRVNAENIRSTFLASFQNLYELYIALLIESGRGSEQSLVAAFEASERARARSLLDLLGETRVSISEGPGAEFVSREREAAQKLNEHARELTQLLSRKHTEEEANGLRKGIEETSLELQEVRARLRQTNPKYSALTQPQPLRLAEVQRQAIDETSLLLEYSLGKERSYLFVVAKRSFKVYELPGRGEIEGAARRLNELLTARNQFKQFETLGEKKARIEKADGDFNQAARSLSQMLLTPVAHQLINQKLLIVTDGALQYIPFAVLPLPQAQAAGNAQLSAPLPKGRRESPPASGRAAYTPLIAAHEVISLPSVSTLAVLRKEVQGRKPAPKTVAVLADPIFDTNDERFKRSQAQRPVPGVAQARIGHRPSTISTRGETGQDQSKARPSQGQADGNRPAAQGKQSMLIIESEPARTTRDTEFDKQGLLLPRIPFTRREAEAITSLVAPSESKEAVDFEASRSTALSPELAQYRYVHFATHGFLNTVHPELSGVVLSMVSEDGKAQDGFLRAHEIFNLRLPAELVVLSGCRTGLGKEIRGEGLIGLTRGFMYAGAARVLVSLWDVNDEATAELMSRFYKAMLGKSRLSPAAALKAAQLSMWKESPWRAPYYWAGFILQGEPN
jgi:CHAT domain-containing protein